MKRFTKLFCSIRLRLALWMGCSTVALIQLCSTALARSAQNEYVEGFDLAAGGSTLTRASREGVLLANPALLALGDSWIRWIGLQSSIYGDLSSLQKIQKGIPKEEEGGETSAAESLFNTLAESPIHFGIQNGVSGLFKYAGIGIVQKTELDLETLRHDDTGMPGLRLRGHVYGAGLVSLAARPQEWLALGTTLKYQSAIQPDVELSLTDPETFEAMQNNPTDLVTGLNLETRTLYDLGGLFIQRGAYTDYMLAIKAEDFALKLPGVSPHNSDPLQPLSPLYHLGLGVCIHSAKSALHLSLDLRDLTGVYKESQLARSHLGVKWIYRRILGVAAGLNQGHPTFGMRLEMFFIKFGATYFTKELTAKYGETRRSSVLVHVSGGF